MDKLLESVLGALLFVCFVYLVIWTVKYLQHIINRRRAKKAREKKQNIKLRTIGCSKNYWYNKQDVEDRPEGRAVESYYHYFNEAKDCIKDLIIEMYDCGLVRTELLEAIAYSGGMVGKEAKDFVQTIHNENVVAAKVVAKEEKKALEKTGASVETIKIPVVDWDLEDLLNEQLAEAEERVRQEASVADEVLREAERILNKDVHSKTTIHDVKDFKPTKRKADKKTAELGKARLAADKRNRKLKEQFEAEDADMLEEVLDFAHENEEPEVVGDPEVAKYVSEALDEAASKKEHAMSEETMDMAENALDMAESELHEAEAEQAHLTEPASPMTKEEKEAFEKEILIKTAVYESWVSYVFQLYELININANEEIRNEIRIALMEYGRNDVSVLLHSPE